MNGSEKPKRKPKMRRFTAERRAQYLEVLARTGNAGVAATAVGLNRSSVEQRVKRDAEFAIAHAAAREQAARRLAGARDSSDGVADPRFEAVRIGRGGRAQIVATRKGKWSRTAEDMFLDALRGCGNVAASARAVGFSESLIWTRRRKWPAFAARIEEALEEAELVLELRLATWGNNLVGNEVGFVEGKGDSPPPAPPAGGRGVFDPDLAMRFLKWREEKRRARERSGAPSGNEAWRAQFPEPSEEDMRDEILKRLAAMRRHREPRQIAEGWTKDEEGRIIPPGWVRASPTVPGSEDDEAGAV